MNNTSRADEGRVKIDPLELAERYRKMTSVEFARVERKTLTREARRAYDSETKRRGLPVPPVVWPVRPDPQELLQQYRKDSKYALYKFALILLALAMFVIVTNNISWSPFAGGGCIVIYYVCQPQKRGHTVLWLRPFHFASHRSLKMRIAISEACRAWGFAVTVQDSTVRASLGEAVVTAAKMGLAVGASLPILLPILNVLVTFGAPGPRDTIFKLAICFLIGLTAAIIGFRKYLYFKVSRPNVEVQIRQILETLGRRRQRFELMALGDVVVVSCTDESWKAAVRNCITGVSAVIIDLTHITDNVLWEVKTAFECLPPRQIILLCGRSDGASEFPKEVAGYLSPYVHPTHLYQASTIAYSLKKLGADFWQHALTSAIGLAIAEHEYRIAVQDATS